MLRSSGSPPRQTPPQDYSASQYAEGTLAPLGCVAPDDDSSSEPLPQSENDAVQDRVIAAAVKCRAGEEATIALVARAVKPRTEEARHKFAARLQATELTLREQFAILHHHDRQRSDWFAQPPQQPVQTAGQPRRSQRERRPRCVRVRRTSGTRGDPDPGSSDDGEADAAALAAEILPSLLDLRCSHWSSERRSSFVQTALLDSYSAAVRAALDTELAILLGAGA